MSLAEVRIEFVFAVKTVAAEFAHGVRVDLLLFEFSSMPMPVSTH